MSNIIAIVFDYDDTLVPDSTTQFLEHYGINTKEFWKKEWKRLIRLQYDPTHAYLKLILDRVGENKPLGKLTNGDLFKFGAEVEKTQFSGLEGLIKDLKKKAAKKFIDIEYYIISSGLEEIIRGNKFIRDNFKAIYGSKLAGDTESGELRYIKRAITFTEKTRYLFEINKGIPQGVADKNPMEVNRTVEKRDRRVSFDNMIYIGDGLTDIPCFSLIKNELNKGTPLGIKHRTGHLSDKIKSYEEILKTGRAEGMYYPEYQKGSDLGDNIRLIASSLCAKLLVGKRS